MKTAVYFKHFLSAFAALSLLCIASSCKDQNFDWDQAHATEQYQKFTNVFIEEFGKPAAGHRWGFDLAWEGATRSAMPITSTRAWVPEPDVDGWIPTSVYNKYASEYMVNLLHYGNVPNITETEHREVYEWFLTHQVEWENTTDESHVVRCENGVSTKNENGTIAVKRAELSEGNSLKDYMTGDLAYWLDSPEVGLTINFHHAFIQNVASGVQFKNPTIFEGMNPFQSDGITDRTDISTDSVAKIKQVLEDIKEYTVDGQHDYTNETKMDYLQFYSKDGEDLHVNDFNSHGNAGWGWGNQKLEDIRVNNDHNEKHYANSILLCGADFNNTTYSSSMSGSSRQDKWIIVYLKGIDYEGWYLGFDLEGSGNNASEKLGANGFCNNWIIKLTSVEKSTSSHSARLMCEDLGAVYNNNNGSDIDYNDIVLDINYSAYETVQAPSGISIPSSAIPTRGELQLTPVAAGGTLPLIVTCGTQTLFEVHEFLEQGRTFIESTSQPASSHTASEESVYKLMINTDGLEEGLNEGYPTDEFSPKTFTVKFASKGTITGKTLLYSSASAPSWDDLIGSQEETNMLKVKVYRFDCDDYRANPLSTVNDLACWVNLGNQTSEAPVMLCVPQTTNWLKERHKISDGYGGFTTWVVNPSNNPLWADEDHGTITASHLYKGLSVAPSYTIDGGSTSSGSSGSTGNNSGNNNSNSTPLVSVVASTNPLNSWSGNYSTTSVIATEDGKTCFKLSNVAARPDDYSAQAVGINYNFKTGESYMVKIKYKTSSNASGSVRLNIQQSADPWQGNDVGNLQVPCTSWKESSFSVKCTKGSDNQPVNNLDINFGHLVGDLFIESIELYQFNS